MRLIFLGTTGYHPNNVRQTACLMLPELGIILDAGTGFFRVRDHIQTEALQVFLTHAHLDHCIGLTYLFDVLHEKEVKSVTVHAEQDKVDAIRQHLFSPLLFPVQPPFEFQPFQSTTVSLPGQGQLTWFPLSHPGGSVGFRLDFPGRSFAYVTDTTATENADYIKNIENVDVLIHECNFQDQHSELAQLTGHSTTSRVAKVAAAANVGRLYMTHFNSLDESADPINLNEARRVFKNSYLANDQEEIQI